MKAIGVVRRIDDLGRIVIPKEIRHGMKWSTGTPIEFFTNDETLVLRKYHAAEQEKEIIELLRELGANTKDESVRDIVCKAVEFIEGR